MRINERNLKEGEMSKRIYVASSWRNNYQPKVVRSLRNFGYSVYDFKNPWNSCPGFHWSDIDPYWQDWTKLSHPIASGYTSDYNAMEWADTFVGVMPFGRSASLEMGWASRQGKKTILLLENG